MRAIEFLQELNVKDTLDFVKRAHAGQQYGSDPYWTHPRKVAAIGKKLFGAKFNDDAIKVAFLHDVVEDTRYTLAQIAKLGFSPEVVQAVGLLTKNKTLSYKDNIKNIIASGNRLAIMVKYADNYANYTGDKSTWDPARAASSQKKYRSSLDMLANKTKVNKHAELDQPVELTEDAVKDLEKDLKNPHSYDAIDHMMKAISKKYNITPKKLHDLFVNKHGVIPDKWITDLEENFADGRNPQDKGDSKRHGVPTKASVTTLRKVAKQGGRKGQLAHWMANMKAGKAKKK